MQIIYRPYTLRRAPSSARLMLNQEDCGPINSYIIGLSEPHNSHQETNEQYVPSYYYLTHAYP